MIIPVVFLQQLGFIRNKTITLHSYPYLSLHWRFTNISVSQSPKMTAQEERAHRNSIWGECSYGCIHLDPAHLLKKKEDLKHVSVYTKTQLTEGTWSGCLHLDPAHSQHHHPSPAPQFTVLKSKHLKIQNHFLCSRLLTITKNKSNIRCSHGCLHFDPAQLLHP